MTRISIIFVRFVKDLYFYDDISNWFFILTRIRVATIAHLISKCVI